jgi:GNAT superfamily N-acetyltransferase
VIRPARDDDIDDLLAAYEWLFAPPGSKPGAWDPPAAAERLREAIASDGTAVFVADVDGRIAGFITAYWDIHSVRFGRRVWVEDLAVDPVQRSHGHGKALLDAAKDWARAKGASHLELDSGEARKDAHRFYMREGSNTPSLSFGFEL